MKRWSARQRGSRNGRRVVLAGVMAAVLGLLAIGCGSDDADDGPLRAAPSAEAFPPADGRSLEEILAEAEPSEDVVVSPAGQTYERGKNRFSFGVFELDRSEIPDAEVAIYAAPGPSGRAAGPFPARVESLATDPEFASETTAAESQPVTVAYVSELEFDRPGEWRLIALVKRAGSTVAGRLPSIEVDGYEAIPDVGEHPPRIHTPTADDVGAVTEIETRIPPDTMHEHDLYEVLGERPAVLLFATPALCVSRVCGPIADIAEQVHAETSDEVAFIHMEVYNDNDPKKGIRPQLEAYGLRTEPWLFVIDASGRVTTRIEGAFSVDELRDAVEKVGPG
jgi:hypothetical protein